MKVTLEPFTRDRNARGLIPFVEVAVKDSTWFRIAKASRPGTDSQQPTGCAWTLWFDVSRAAGGRKARVVNQSRERPAFGGLLSPNEKLGVPVNLEINSRPDIFYNITT